MRSSSPSRATTRSRASPRNGPGRPLNPAASAVTRSSTASNSAEGGDHPRTARSDPFTDSVEMIGQAPLPVLDLNFFLSRSCTRQSHADGTAPGVKHVHHVLLAEVDLHGPAPRTFRVVAHEVPIDTLTRDLERNPLRRPPAHALEGRPDDSDEVPVVLAAEVGFDFAAVLLGGHWQSRGTRVSVVYFAPRPYGGLAA